ncbi:MAG: hypothetical protein HRK26_04605 [Rickettsiaceae bacterium H1]|nr:hypothetical protein [Rickettsiaceae bacterium H1]
MSICSADVKIMMSAIRLAAKSVTRDFYEINDLQSSYNSLGVKKFADMAYNKSQAIIEKELQRFRPDIGFNPDEGKECYWDISPISGKNNFDRAIPFFAVSISLLRNHEVISVVTMLPISGEIFWAEKGVGAYLDTKNKTSKLRIGNVNDSQDIIVGLSGINGRVFRAMQGMRYRIMGSSCMGILYVVLGKTDVFLYPKSPIDYSLLIKEASGLIAHVGSYSIVGKHNIVSILAERIKNG